MSKRNSYIQRIIVEDPPAPKIRGRRPTNHMFLQKVAEQAPGQWVVFRRNSKSMGAGHYLTKHPDWAGKVEFVTRRNPNGTHNIWVRVFPDGIPAKS